MSTPPMTSLEDQVLDELRAGSSVILSGPNTGDLFPGVDGAYRIIPLLSRALARAGWSPVVVSGRGIRQPVSDDGPSVSLPGVGAGPGPLSDLLPELLESIASADRSVAVFVDAVDLTLSDGSPGMVASPEHQRLLEAVLDFPVNRQYEPHRLILVTRTDSIDPRIARSPGFETVRAGLPDLPARTFMARRIIDLAADPSGPVAGPEDGLPIEEFALLTGGLTNHEMRELARRARSEGRRISRRDIQEAKCDRIEARHLDTLQVHRPGAGLDAVAGNEVVKRIADARSKVNMFMRVLAFAGPPGTGKTMRAAALGDYLGWPVVMVGNLRSMWQGESERRQRQLIDTAKAMAPVCLVIDEAEGFDFGQREGRRDADGGTGARQTGEWLKFFGDSLLGVPVLAIICTNRVDLLDEAILSRAEVVPILDPTPSVQADILVLAARAEGREVSSQAARATVNALSGQTVSGRTLVKVVHGAAVLAGSGATSLGEDDLVASANDLWERPDSVANEFQALLAIERTTRRSYFPWNASGPDARRDMPSYLLPLLGQGGEVDREKLRARIDELRALNGQSRGVSS